jgi:Bacterial PH domain
MSIDNHGHEHELEPQYGLPERLPAGEHIVWQGSPDFRALALQVFHVRKVALYFAALMALRVTTQMAGGMALSSSLAGLALPLVLALSGLAALTTLAWLTARTTVYTLTNRRVVMRIGIVLTLALNVPLRIITSAGLRRQAAGSGDIVMQLSGDDHLAWLHMWPHVRPWRLKKPEPMLRAVSDAPRVAQLLAQAWSAQSGIAVPAAVAPEATPQPAGASTPQWRPSPI